MVVLFLSRFVSQ